MNVTDSVIVEYYAGGWIGFQILLSISVLISTTTFIVSHTNHRLRQRSHLRLSKYLVGIGALWSCVCLIQCIINGNRGQYEGGNWACDLQSMYMLFFILMNGWSLCVMAFSTERKLYLTQVKKQSIDHYMLDLYLQSPRSIRIVHLFGACIFAVFSVSLSLWTTEATLEPSNTFCFVSFSSHANSVLFFLPVALFAVLLTYWYYRIFYFVVQFYGGGYSGANPTTQLPQPSPLSVDTTPSFRPMTPIETPKTPNSPLTLKPQNTREIVIPILPVVTERPEGSESKSWRAVSESPSRSEQLQKNLGKRMIVFVLSYVLCCLPAAVISFFQIFSSDLWIDTNPILYLIAAHVIHLQPIVNSILYIWLSPSAQMILRQYGKTLLTLISGRNSEEKVVPLPIQIFDHGGAPVNFQSKIPRTLNESDIAHPSLRRKSSPTMTLTTPSSQILTQKRIYYHLCGCLKIPLYIEHYSYRERNPLSQGRRNVWNRGRANSHPIHPGKTVLEKIELPPEGSVYPDPRQTSELQSDEKLEAIIHSKVQRQISLKKQQQTLEKRMGILFPQTFGLYRLSPRLALTPRVSPRPLATTPQKNIFTFEQ